MSFVPALLTVFVSVSCHDRRFTFYRGEFITNITVAVLRECGRAARRLGVLFASRTMR